MKFKAISIWQGDFGWELHLKKGKFENTLAAARYANRQTLEYNKSQKQLIVEVEEEGIIERHVVLPEQLTVRRLKPASSTKLVCTNDDYPIVQVKIEDFSYHEGLTRGFDSLAYEVEDENENIVDLTEIAKTLHQQWELERQWGLWEGQRKK